MRKVEQGMAVPDDPDTRLTRDATSAALIEAGFPVSPATLATKATRGGGPPFQKFGARPLYVWRDALAWAQSRLGAVVTSTSELDAVTPARRRPRSEIRRAGQNQTSAMDGKTSPHQRVIGLVETAHPGAPDIGREP